MSDEIKPPRDAEDPSRFEDPTLGLDPDATLSSAAGAAVPGESPGTRIGRYKLIRPLGEGGFGTVFLAEQLEPVSREVALKIIKLGMDTKQVIARFEAERQALAMMDHPGIAKVYDAGATDAGRPYFVMELVRGVPITEYCDRHRLRTRARLALFNQVCAAVQHAHQKGIIHRDIKPSNVLVTEVEGKAVPKVIDFGIAKATNQRLTEKTLFTQQAQIIGTPAYMSPEQAEVGEVDIDTRSDVYSLGVLLYELLAGVTPFDSRTLLSAGYAEIQRIIKEVDPPRPSLRVSSLGEQLEETAEHRQLHGAQLAKRLKGELDWIVMKCLEKDRDRRYETANGLARDVERFLCDEPVTASPPSRSYRLKKLIVRNRAVFAAGLAMALLLSAGIVGTSVGLVRAKRAEREAVVEAAKSDRVATFLTDMLTGVGPSAARGRDTEMLEEILQETHEKLGVELAGQPEVEGTIRSFLGMTYYDLGNYEQAIEQWELARDQLTAAHGEMNGDVAKQYNNLGLVAEALQDYETAEAEMRHALAIRLEVHGEEHSEVADSQMALANLLVNVSRYEEAEPLLRSALATQRATLGEENEIVAISLNSLGNLMQHLRRYEEAGPFYDEALAMHTKVLGEDHPYVITDNVNLGWLHYNLGDYPTALGYFTGGETIGRRVYGESNPRLAPILTARADCEQKLGNTADAEALLLEAIALSSEAYGPEDIVTSEVLHKLADLQIDTGRVAEGVALNERVLAIQAAEYGAYHPTTIRTQHNIAYGFYERGEYDEAVRRLRIARENYTEAYGLEDKSTAQVINSVGRALRERGDLDEAATTILEARAIRERVLGPDHLYVAVSDFDLAETRRAEGRLDEALALMESVVVGYIAGTDSTHREVGNALAAQANVLLDLGRNDRALATVRRARALLEPAFGEDDEHVVLADLTQLAARGRGGDTAGADSILAAVEPRLGVLAPRLRLQADVLLGRHLTLRGRYEDAERALTSSYVACSELYRAGHYETRRAIDGLVELYGAWAAAGSPTAEAEAERWRARRAAR
jgi:serine/threonine protein kinase/tetratricopeptide (TPR) repeat protein